jgi:hypothetical protein
MDFNNKFKEIMREIKNIERFEKDYFILTKNIKNYNNKK